MEDKKKKIEKIKESNVENIDLALVEELLKNNEHVFSYKEVKYKVRKATFGEKEETYRKRVEKEISMIQAKDENGNYIYKSLEDLKEIYKERGIDVESMDSEFLSMEKKKNDFNIKLGKGLKENKPNKELKIYHDEIEILNQSQKELSFKKAKLLESSIENQLDIFTYSYLTYLVGEKMVDEKWVRIWNSYKDFKNTPEDIVNKISYYAVLILQNEV